MRAFKIATCVFVSALALPFGRASLADYRVINHSNDVVSVTVSFHLPNGHLITTGWKTLAANEERVVYFGSEPQILVAMLRGPNRVQVVPSKYHGTSYRFVHAFSVFANEDDNVPGIAKLSREGQVYFYKVNTSLPPGWYSQLFFVLNGNETFEVVP